MHDFGEPQQGPVYVHELPDWELHPYAWDQAALSDQLAAIHFRRGRLLAAMANLGFESKRLAVLSVLSTDVSTSSEIEGESLSAAQVRSSVARRLGMDYAGLPEPDRQVAGVVDMMLDATQNFAVPLTEERLFAWHAALFPTGRSGLHRIAVGQWRDDEMGPMRVVSGPIGRETIHFEAPSANRIPAEMARFLAWFEGQSMDPVVKAAVAHLWFVTIHPLDDGNGRVGRAIMDMALARADGSGQRFYSLSAQILKARKSYYDVLERTQKVAGGGDNPYDLTAWIGWFLERMDAALVAAETLLEGVRIKQAFWDAHSAETFNPRQVKVLNLLFDGFEGKLQTSKYAVLTKSSADTALRDLTDLVKRGILEVEAAGGRSTSYRLRPDLDPPAGCNQ